MKIGSFSVDWYYHEEQKMASMGACCYHRIAMPLRALQARGYEVVLGIQCAFANDGTMLVAEGDGTWQACDVVVMQRLMGGDVIPLIERARSTGQIILQDVDDLFWGLPFNHPARWITDPKTDPKSNREHYRSIIKASSGIITSTGFLETYLSRFGPPVHLCRNAIELAQWPDLRHSDDLRVAWIGAKAWRAPDLAPLVGVLGPFLEEHGGEFVHVGQIDAGIGKVTPIWQQLGIPEGVKHSALPLTTMWDYSKAWNNLSFVVVPLENTPFNVAKSYLRGLEASAARMPFIASQMPEYEELGVGRLAKRKWEWREHMEALLDPAVRRAEGLANRERAVELSIDNLWHQWADVFAGYGVRPPADTLALAA